jgi:hypothetical protein
MIPHLTDIYCFLFPLPEHISDKIKTKLCYLGINIPLRDSISFAPININQFFFLQLKKRDVFCCIYDAFGRTLVSPRGLVFRLSKQENYKKDIAEFTSGAESVGVQNFISKSENNHSNKQ